MAGDPAGRDRALDDMPALLGLAAEVGARAAAAGRTIVTAESCTGGLVGHLLTEIPGSSAWYLGGAVVYSDALKRGLTDVPAALLAAHGAVSGEVAASLADGARERFGGDIGVAVTGIAGPTGATPTKPVGLVYVAVADGARTVVRRAVWDGDRSANKRASAGLVLRLLLGWLPAAPATASPTTAAGSPTSAAGPPTTTTGST